MENVRDFAGNRATKAPRARRPVQPTQGPTSSYRVLSVRTYAPPKSTVNRILQMTHGILRTPRVIPNLASARTTASPQRERQTSQTGKGGAHDQDPLHDHHQTRENDQRIAPQHGGHDRNLREGDTAIARAKTFNKPKFEPGYLAGTNQEYTSLHLAIQRRKEAATGLVTRPCTSSEGSFQTRYKNSSLRATLHQPTSKSGDKNIKGADGTAARRDAIKTGAGIQNQLGILCGEATSPTEFRRKKGVSINNQQRRLQANKGWQSAASA